MLPSLPDISCFVEFLMDWSEKHSGLGSWVGALGSVLAIFAAWLLARLEYRRNQRREAIRRKGEIDLICKIISDFEAAHSVYINALRTGTQAQLVGFYNQHMNDPEWHSMRDLAFLPVTHWPSLETYTRFKQYWFISIRLLETSHQLNPPTLDITKALNEHDARFKELNTALRNARP